MRCLYWNSMYILKKKKIYINYFFETKFKFQEGQKKYIHLMRLLHLEIVYIAIYGTDRFFLPYELLFDLQNFKGVTHLCIFYMSI